MTKRPKLKTNLAFPKDTLTYSCRNTIFNIPIEYEEVQEDEEEAHRVVTKTVREVHQLTFSGVLKFFDQNKGIVRAAAVQIDDLIPVRNHFDDYEQEEIKSLFVNYIWDGCEEIDSLYSNIMRDEDMRYLVAGTRNDFKEDLVYLSLIHI